MREILRITVVMTLLLVRQSDLNVQSSSLFIMATMATMVMIWNLDGNYMYPENLHC